MSKNRLRRNYVKTKILNFGLVGIGCTLFVLMSVACGGAGEEALPPIDSLELLPVSEVADFTGLEELAGAPSAVVFMDSRVYFFDSRLRQLFASPLRNPSFEPIGRSGAGPGEYEIVSSLWSEAGLLYALDTNRKIICFSTEGDLIWEEKLESGYNKILGKQGEKFFFTAFEAVEYPAFFLAVSQWERGVGSETILSRPILTGKGNAIVEGKVVEGGGIMFLASPAYAVSGDKLWAAAGSEYLIEIFNLNGEAVSSICMQAPTPDKRLAFKWFPDLNSTENYAVAAICPHQGDIWIISNYFQEGHSRIDLYSREGKRRASYLLPMEFDPPRKDVLFTGDYLVFCDADQVGFKVYRVEMERGG